MSAETADLAADTRAVRSTSSPVLGMVLFVASESMFFAAFFAVFAMTYSSSPAWPPKGIPKPGLVVTGVATALIAASGLLVHAGVAAIRRGRARRLVAMLVATLAVGVAYAALQLVELQDVGFGIDHGTYASLFYVLTGLALAHVAGGGVFLGMIVFRTATGQLAARRQDPAEAAAIYWYFVIVVAVVLYLAFYVLAAAHPKGG
jgi:cytochrome c oxidase subunit III